jgi:hypothetical protein
MWTQVPALVASAAMVLLGITALIRPTEFGALIGLRAEKPVGTSELRAAFGGLFIGLGVGAIVIREPAVFGMLGAAWFAGSAVRIVSVFADHVSAKSAIPFLFVGIALGTLFLSALFL